jgi:hypothetical protein
LIALILTMLPAQVVAQTASAWPEADRLFRSDPSWLGGDAAFSIDLGNNRVLWLFGDSFVAKSASATRSQSAFIRNSVAIETGYDPSHARIQFYEGQRNGQISDFAPSNRPGTWLWPMQGTRLGNRLLLVFTRVASDSGKDTLGFRVAGWTAFLVDNPGMPPDSWNLRPLAGPNTNGSALVGMSVLHEEDFVYAFVLGEPVHDAYLLRWPASDAANGQLLTPQWWCGAGEGWRPDITKRQIVIRNAGAEFSVQHAPGGGFIEVNSEGFGATTIVSRRAPSLNGPWSKPQVLYRPPESSIAGLLVYGAKSHPELSGGDLIITYAANGPPDRLETDMSIYFPRFVKATLH